MNIESLKIKTKTDYDWDNAVYIYDINLNSIEIIKRESRIGINIYYIGYMSEHDNSIISLYLIINRLTGFIEEIEGTSDRYLVVSMGNKKIINIFDELWKFIENKITSNSLINNSINKIKEYNELRFNSDLYLPTDKLIEFRMLKININCVFEKDSEYYPKIYLDERLYVNDDYLKEYTNNGNKIIKN